MNDSVIKTIDIGKVIDKIMDYQSLGLYRMKTKEQAEQIQIGAYNSLSSLFGSFQTSLANLGSAFNTIAFQASSSNSLVANASVTSNSIAVGTHSVVVSTLAQAQNFSSTPFSGETTQLSLSETLTFTNINNTNINFSLQVNPTDTLQNIRDNINNSQNNFGVTASIITSTATNGNPQYSLVLTTQTGTINQIMINDPDSSFGFTTFGPPPADATFTFDGFTEVSSSNQVNNILDGLSLTLTGTGSATVTIAPSDTSIITGVQSALQDMLTSYNQIMAFLDGNQYVTVYDKDNRQYTSLYNDTFPFIKSSLQAAMNQAFQGSSDITSLAQAGIILGPSQKVTDKYDTRKQFTTTGNLNIDQTIQQDLGGENTLTWVLNNDFSALQNFVTNAQSGLIANVNNVLNNSIVGQTNQGIIYNATNTTQTMANNTNDQIESEMTRLDGYRDKLIMQYSKLNATLSKYQGIYDFLDKQYNYFSTMNK